MVDDESLADEVEPEADAVDEEVALDPSDVPLPFACGGGGGGGKPSPCCDTAEKRSPRNCWSALLAELDEALLPVSVVDAVELELEPVSVEEVLELVDAVSPIWASAAAIAAASGLVLALLLEVESLASAWDSRRFAMSVCQICELALVSVKAEIDIGWSP